MFEFDSASDRTASFANARMIKNFGYHTAIADQFKACNDFLAVSPGEYKWMQETVQSVLGIKLKKHCYMEIVKGASIPDFGRRKYPSEWIIIKDGKGLVAKYKLKFKGVNVDVGKHELQFERKSPVVDCQTVLDELAVGYKDIIDILSGTGSLVPTGKTDITGTIEHIKWVNNGYGAQVKCRIKMDSYAVWGTVPKNILKEVDLAGLQPDVLTGMTISMNARLSPSNEDPSFGFFSHGKKAKLEEHDLAMAILENS